MIYKTNVLLQRLGVVYGAPQSDNPQGFIAEYARLMSQYVESELGEAADRLLKIRKYKTWPSPAEIIAVLEDVRAAKRARALAQQRQQSAPAKKVYTDAELREAERFVDDCADGKIQLGFCAGLLRDMAKKMRARRLEQRGRP